MKKRGYTDDDLDKLFKDKKYRYFKDLSKNGENYDIYVKTPHVIIEDIDKNLKAKKEAEKNKKSRINKLAFEIVSEI